MMIVTASIPLAEVQVMADHSFGDMVKAVVDIRRELVALDAELHADLEALLIEDGSKQEHLWGINLYPALPSQDLVEFDSLINIRPRQGNPGRGVEDENIRRKILDIVATRIKP